MAAGDQLPSARQVNKGTGAAMRKTHWPGLLSTPCHTQPTRCCEIGQVDKGTGAGV